MTITAESAEITAALQSIADWVLATGKQCYENGQKLCELIDLNPDVDVRGMLARMCGDKNMRLVARLEKIGRKIIHPDLFLKVGKGWEALAVMPYDIQEKYLSTPVEVVEVQDGKTSTLLVAVEDLRPTQVAQVFDTRAGIVRDRGAQRAYVSDLIRSLPAPDEVTLPYRVSGRKVHWLQKCTVDLQEMLQIVSQMKA